MQQISTLCLLHLIELDLNKKYKTAKLTFSDLPIIKYVLDCLWSNKLPKRCCCLPFFLEAEVRYEQQFWLIL